MHDDSDLSERTPVDYFLFALAFISFVWAVGGVILSSPLLAITGATLLVLVLLGSLPRRLPEK